MKKTRKLFFPCLFQGKKRKKDCVKNIIKAREIQVEGKIREWKKQDIEWKKKTKSKKRKWRLRQKTNRFKRKPMQLIFIYSNWEK